MERESTINILRNIEFYLTKNPSIRFAQALFNLGVNEFADKDNPEKEKHQLRDIYNDTNNEVCERIKEKFSKMSHFQIP